MKSRAIYFVVLLLIVLLVTTMTTSCSPGYVLRAAYEQGKIIYARKPIEDALESAETSEEEKEKLRVVVAAREFSKTLGLDPKNTFTSFARVDRYPLLWVVAGSKPDAFELYTWWFPIVGRTPYKGFFDQDDAKDEAHRLQEKGYETWVRGSDAFSTLGWFDDPVLSTTLRHNVVTIADTVIHETVHTTVWIPNHVDFNESLANFVGGEGAVRFFSTIGPRELATQAEQAHVQEEEVAKTIDTLYENLSRLYSGDLPHAEKLAQRQKIFEAGVAPLRAKFPNMKILQTLNNAEIMQLKFYLTGLGSFRELFASRKADFSQFMSGIRDIQTAVKNDSSQNPFQLLNQIKSATYDNTKQ